MTAAATHEDAVALARRLGVALSDDEVRRIAARLERVPTPTELYAFDAQWSEHCSYKSSREHLRKLPTKGEHVILGVGEDAGILRLGKWKGETYGIVVAHESHNHPSQVVPFEGAATGVGGIVRDVLCMGAEVIGFADMLRFGRRENAHARYVAQSVVDGIAAYGNAIGVPNLAGDTFFDASFDDNVLVNVIALGLVKQKEIVRSRAPAGAAGWDIVLVGKATDRSGFGGASFASLVLDEDDAEQNKGAVQVPDPFLKNVLMRATYAAFAEMRRLGIEAGFKDLGAGGLMGCTAELCAAGGAGAEIELDRVAAAQRDLPPEVIAVGETQERLCWIVPPSFTPALLAIYNDVFALPRIARGACAAAIGKVTASGRYVAHHRGEVVMDVPLDFLTGGVRSERPYELPRERGEAPRTARRRAVRAALGAAGTTPLELLRTVLRHRDVCSRAPIFTRYDGVVRGCTSIPVGYADAGVLVPIPGAPLAVALGVGGNPRYGHVDARAAAELAVAEAVAQVAAVGATPVGLTDCLNFGDPTIPAQMGAFVAAVDGLAAAARGLALPFVSGNVSLYNRSASGAHVAPSALVACVGTMSDVATSLTPPLKSDASMLFVLQAHAFGEKARFGGSVFAEVVGLRDAPLPRVSFERLDAFCTVLRKGAASGTIVAARDISDGGPLAAIAEMAFAAQAIGTTVGVHIGVPKAARRDWAALFDETPGFVVEVPLARLGDFSTLLLRETDVTIAGAGFLVMPTRNEPEFVLFVDEGAPIEHAPIAELRELWEAPLRDFYEDAV